MTIRRHSLILFCAFFAATLFFPAVASAGESKTTTSATCVLGTDVPAGFGEFETAVAGVSLANEERSATETRYAEAAEESEQLSELEAEAAAEIEVYLTDIDELTTELVTRLENSVDTVESGGTIDIVNLTDIDLTILAVAEQLTVLEAEQSATPEAAQTEPSLATVTAELEAFSTQLAIARPVLVANIDAAALAVYSKPTTVTIAKLVDVRSIAADEALAASRDLVADSEAIQENLSTLASAEAALDGKIEADVLSAVRGSIANTNANLALVRSALDGRATTMVKGLSSPADLVGMIGSLKLDLAANQAAISSVSRELSSTIEGQDAATQTSRAAASAAMADIDTKSAALLTRMDAALGVATKTTARAALKSMASPVPSAASAFTSPHPANAAVFQTAAADSLAIDSAAAAGVIASLADSATPRSALSSGLTDLAATMRSVSAADASSRGALAADGLVVAEAGRFAAPSTLLADSRATLSSSATSIQASRAELLAIRIADGSPDATTRESAIAAIDRSLGAVAVATASLDAAIAVRAKYTLAVSRETVTAREPVVATREPIATVEETAVATREPIATVEETAVATREPIATVRGVSTTQARYDVVEGSTFEVDVATLAAGETSVTVSLDGVATHGTLALVEVDDTCELVFTSEPGCLGLQTVELEIDVDGVVTTKIIELFVSAAEVETTQQNSQIPAVLAFTGPSSALVLAIAGASLIVLGTIVQALGSQAGRVKS